jgi:hypothetical protein
MEVEKRDERREGRGEQEGGWKRREKGIGMEQEGERERREERRKEQGGRVTEERGRERKSV